MKKEDNWYKNKRWKYIRGVVLRRDKYMDVYQKMYGKIREATLVHHVFPREEYPEYQYELWNLISLSIGSHNLMHDRNTNELTEIGTDTLRRIARLNNIPIPEKYQKKKVRSGRRRYAPKV